MHKVFVRADVWSLCYLDELSEKYRFPGATEDGHAFTAYMIVICYNAGNLVRTNTALHSLRYVVIPHPTPANARASIKRSFWCVGGVNVLVRNVVEASTVLFFCPNSACTHHPCSD